MDSTLLKGMLQSKTMWLNAAVMVLGALGWVQDHNAVILALAPQLGPLLTVLGGVGMVLRILTESTPLWKAPVVEAVPVPVQPASPPAAAGG